MGTRGLWGFKVDGQYRVTYNHFDSYPDGLGQTFVDFLARSNLDEVKTMARGLTLVNDDEKPTPEQQKVLQGFADTSVSTRSLEEWYVLLRDCQGDPEKTLASKFMIDSFSFGYDSLFCEWGYVADLDDGSFTVYEGFQKQEHRSGPWGDRPPNQIGVLDAYYGIRPVKTVMLIALKSGDADKALLGLEE